MKTLRINKMFTSGNLKGLSFEYEVKNCSPETVARFEELKRTKQMVKDTCCSGHFVVDSVRVIER